MRNARLKAAVRCARETLRDIEDRIPGKGACENEHLESAVEALDQAIGDVENCLPDDGRQGEGE